MFGNFASHHCIQFQEKLKIQTKENGKRPHFGPKCALPIFFFLNLASSVTRYHGHLLLCIVSEETNDPIILRKFSDGSTGRRMDRWRE